MTGPPDETTHVAPPDKWVRVSGELLPQLGEWSEPVRVKVVRDEAGVLDLIFERVDA